MSCLVILRPEQILKQYLCELRGLLCELCGLGCSEFDAKTAPQRTQKIALALRPVHKLFMPSHLDGFELALIRFLGIVFEIR